MLNPTILKLSSQGFFCIAFYKPYTKKDGEYKKAQTFSRTDRRDGIPAVGDFKSSCIPPEKWQELFQLKNWKKVDRIAIVAGGNGVLAFDFDIKHFPADTEDFNRAWQIWKKFKFHLEVSNIPFYLERSKSGGEHVILLCDHDVENFQPTGDICPVFSTEFIECFAKKCGNALPQSITIAPSEGYKQLSEVSLLNLPRINFEQRECVMSFFTSYQQEHKEKQVKNVVSPVKKKKDPKEFKHYLTQKEIWDHIRRDHNLVQELESLGYVRRGNRISKPNKSNTDIQLYENDTKFKCFSTSDQFYCGTNDIRDVIDVLRYKYGDNHIKELYNKILEQHAPHQITNDFLSAQNYDEVLKAIHKSSADRIVMNVYESPDKSQTVLQVKTTSGDLRYFDLHEFLGQKLEGTGATFFESGEYRTASGSFSPLKIRVLDEKLMAPRKLLLETSCWIDGRFYSNSSDECYIRNELTETSEASFEEWKTNVFDVAVKSSGTSLGMLMGFAAPLIDILHQSFGVNLVGDSNIGKTMALRISKGMFRDTDRLESWRGTVSAIEMQKLYCANSVLCLDEMYHADEGALGSIMQLCGVTERKRCSWDGTKLNMAKSNEAPVLILSSSEIPFLQAAKKYQMQVTKGQLNRFLDFNVTKNDFLRSEELTSLFHAIKKTKGVAIVKLCEFLQEINISTLQEQFKDYTQKYKERLSKMPFAKQRVLTHLIFLDFVADFVSEKLNIDGRQMFENVKILFDRFLCDSQEVLEDGDAIELSDIKEKIRDMLRSGKNVCSNDPNNHHRVGDDTCFFSEYEARCAITTFYCFKERLINVLSRDLNLSKKKVQNILARLNLFSSKRKYKYLVSLNSHYKVYEIINQDLLDPDQTEIID